MRKVCFAGPKDSALNLFFICCFVVASFNFSFFSLSSPQDILQEEKKRKKEAGYKSTFGVPVCFRILQSAVMRGKQQKKGDFFFFVPQREIATRLLAVQACRFTFSLCAPEHSLGLERQGNWAC